MGVGLQSGLSAVDVYDFWGDRPGSRDAISKHREGARSIASLFSASCFSLSFTRRDDAARDRTAVRP
jgi:hypothetical protein